MFTVEDIYDDAQKIVGTCADNVLFRRITTAVELLANKGDFDPLIGFVDLCVQDRNVTLPREVEMIYGLNVSGRPTLGQDQFFSFHLNGPGDFQTCDWTWRDGGDAPTYRDLTAASKLIAFVTHEDDADSELWAYGYDEQNNWIRSEVDGVMVDGYQVPTVLGYALPDADAPTFTRVVRVRKAITKGPIRLGSYDNSFSTGTLLGIFQWNETEPLYRRLTLGRSGCKTVRIAFRRRTFKIVSRTDLIPLHSTEAVLAMLRSMKAYANDDIALGQGHEATAVRFVSEEQETRSPNVTFPIQVNPRNQVSSRDDDWVS